MRQLCNKFVLSLVAVTVEVDTGVHIQSPGPESHLNRALDKAFYTTLSPPCHSPFVQIRSTTLSSWRDQFVKNREVVFLHRGCHRRLQVHCRNRGKSLGVHAGPSTPNISLSWSVLGTSSSSLIFLFALFQLQEQVASLSVNVPTAERDEVSSRCKCLKSSLKNVGKEVRTARNEGTAVAEKSKMLELENRCLRAEKEWLQRMVKEVFTTVPDPRRKKGSYILSELEDKYFGIVSQLLASFPKYCSR